MKKFLSILVSFAMLLSILPSCVFAEDTSEASAPVLYYSFDNGAAADIGETAQSFNVSFSEDSVSGKAAFFDGGTSYLELPDVTASMGDDFTVSAWVRFDSPNWWMRVFDFGSGTESYAFLGLAGFTDVRYALLTPNTSGELNVTAANAVEDNKWVHLTLVRDNETMRIYKNGALAAQSEAFGAHSPAELEGASCYIGKSQFDPDPYFHGLIDEFKIYSRALSDKEIVSDMAGEIKFDLASYIAESANLYDGATVKDDLNLVSFDNGTYSLDWLSSDEETISPEGRVTRGDEDKIVALTARISRVGEDEPLEITYNLFVPAVSNTDVRITVDASEKGVDINPNMIGLFFEDINYAADGGLYAELIQNRSFEAVNAQGHETDPLPIPDYSWAISADYSFRNENPLNENNTTYLHISNPKNLDSVTNSCYSGFAVKQGEKLDLSFFFRSNGFGGRIMASVKDGDRLIGRSYLEPQSSEWEKYEAEIIAIADSTNASLTLTLLSDEEASDEAYIDLDMVSLFPQDTWMNRENGLRRDLVQMLKDFHPGFLRFPGGCIVEGFNLANRYSWKDTVGPVEARRENWNRWQTHTSGDGRYGYCQTYGLGFYEYFLLCEDIGALALPVLNVGIACEYQSGETSSMDDLYDIYIPDALDLIEFANGDPDKNEWARLRADMGHPKPFNLEYLGIGNEQWEEHSARLDVNFHERYEAFEKAIHEKYPEMKLIATSGPDASDEVFDAAWTWLNSHAANGEENFAEAVDEHYYRSPDWFYNNLDRYDGYDRNSYKVFAGEYASRYFPGTKESSNMEAALSLAAFMTSLEKNADIVSLASYAPLFSRDGYSQWYPDMIGFDNSRVFGTPDYYVQSMYSNNTGSYTLPSETENASAPYIPYGKVGVGTYNTQAVFSDVQVYDTERGEYLPLDSSQITGAGEWSRGGDGSYIQSSYALGTFNLFDITDSDNLVITFKATKTGGNEGFFIPLLYEDENNYFAWNVGGWQNSCSAIQRFVDGVKIGDEECYSLRNTTADARIETNREYDVRIEITPEKLSCCLDDKLINFISFRQNVYSTSSYDETTGDIIIKAVNTADTERETTFEIKNASYINPVADVTELKTDNIYSLNSLDSPKTVSPVSFETDVSESFIYRLPANSLSIIRIHTKGDDELTARSETVEITLTKGEELVLPQTVHVTYKDGTTGDAAVTWDSVPGEFTQSSGRTMIEGKIDGTRCYAYANVTVYDTNKAVISLTDENTVEFSVVFDEGRDASLRAFVAGFDKEGTLIFVKSSPLTPESPYWELSLDELDEAVSAKAFVFNNSSYYADYLQIK